jgi:hypothetical protein
VDRPLFLPNCGRIVGEREVFMALMPNRAKLIHAEQNVDIPAAAKTGDAYDLALFEETGTSARAVLEVTIILSFKFVDGGGSLLWTAKEKTDFMDNFKTDVAAAWAEKHQLTFVPLASAPAGTPPGAPAATTAGVIFNIKAAEDMGVTDHSHWNVTVTKVSAPTKSETNATGGGPLWNGESTMDSFDLTTAVAMGAPAGTTMTQRAAVHEFGHMLGFWDEYPGGYHQVMGWSAEPESIMYFGEVIKPRHYVFFSDWLSRLWQSRSPGVGANSWKVNGTLDLTKARV